MQFLFARHIILTARLLVTLDTDELEETLRGNIARLRSPRPFLQNVLAMLRADARRQFSVGGDPAWPGLAASTIAAKTKMGLPALTAKGNIPTRLKQGGVFGPGGIGIATGRRRDGWGRKDSRDHIEEIDEQAGTASIGSKVPYEVFQSLGTKPYTIRPVNAKALAFTGADGRTRLAKSVHHPGLKPRPVRVSALFSAEAKEALVGFYHGENQQFNNEK